MMNAQLHGLLSRVLKTALALLLLAFTWLLPVAGWHRLYLKVPGWYWWAVAGYFAIASAMLFFITHRHFWLAGFLPQVALLVYDCILIVDRVWRAAR